MARIVITSGPTRQYIDPVRYLSNASSGQMGRSLCEAALKLGHDVTVISGPVQISYPDDATVIKVVSTGEMLGACLKQFEDCDGIIGAAAPCDYQPVNVADHKIRKTGEPLSIELVETQDIMAACGRRKREGQWSVGFALETDDARFRALTKLQKKNCDLVVLNGVSAIESTENSVEIIEPAGDVIAETSGSKAEVANLILSVIQERLIGGEPLPGNVSPNAEPVIGIRLQPRDPEVDAIRSRMRDKPLPEVARPLTADKTGPAQFNIWFMMILTTWVAIACALFQIFEPPYVAGGLGIMAMFSWIGIQATSLRRTLAMRYWWILFVIYIAISAVAIAVTIAG